MSSDVSHSLNGEEFVKVVTEQNQTLRLTFKMKMISLKIADAPSARKTRLSKTDWGDASAALD